MNLALFCNLYIIAEYFYLKRVLDAMPRYRVGTHRGNVVIREYSGNSGNLTKLETKMNTKSFAEAQKNLEKYDSCIRAKKLFCEEINRRHLAIPSDFKFMGNPSKLNVDHWNREVPCSNKYECDTEYYDDYGFNVRSRGEMIVGNALKSLGLEAKCEPRLDLNGSKTKNPDYSFPVHIIDRCFFVEFMGMMDKEEYVNDNTEKMRLYMRNGILPNRDLILISGTKNWIPSQESIARTIASFINNAVLDAYNRQG